MNSVRSATPWELRPKSPRLRGPARKIRFLRLGGPSPLPGKRRGERRSPPVFDGRSWDMAAPERQASHLGFTGGETPRNRGSQNRKLRDHPPGGNGKPPRAYDAPLPPAPTLPDPVGGPSRPCTPAPGPSPSCEMQMDPLEGEGCGPSRPRCRGGARWRWEPTRPFDIGGGPPFPACSLRERPPGCGCPPSFRLRPPNSSP